jgi:hypothetical protein
MLNLCGIVVAILKMATGRNFSMSGINSGHHNLPTYEMTLKSDKIQNCSISTSRIDSRHWKISTGLHFQNGHHNTTKIQHCSISKVAFNLFFNFQWDDEVRFVLDQHDSESTSIGQCWICAVLWRPFGKWRPVEIFRCQESIRDIIIYPHMKWHWNRTMLNLCGIVIVS